MKQLVQPLGGGPVRLLDVPAPQVGPTEVLVRTSVSTISSGTERAVTALARSSLLGKARARPDLVRQVVARARTEGIVATGQAVRRRLEGYLPLGYSAAGTVVQVGSAVEGLRPGDRVATAGAGAANHAELQAVPGLLCAKVPDGVSASQAAFATLGAIALHGLRQAEVGPGSKVVVQGLGLVGQLAVRLALASGCDVLGLDVGEGTLDPARRAGATALLDHGADTTAIVLEWSRGRGADAVLVTASGSTAMARVPALCRDRATVVVVGDVGLDLERTPFYERELTIRFSRSYGPGRYDRSYEDWAVDYPAGHVRWTEGRNLEAVLDLLRSGRVEVDDLVTHSFPIDEAAAAYELLDGPGPALGIQLSYDHAPRPASARPASVVGGVGVGLLGGGAFARGRLLPALRSAGLTDWVAVASGSGLAAAGLVGDGFRRAVTPEELLEDPEVGIVVITTPHDDHAELTCRALAAGKHVWCEKPVVLTLDELDAVERAWRDSGRVLAIGCNRRWSPAVAAVVAHVAGGAGPLTVTYRVSAGPVPDGHWLADRRQGGRLLGEVCHFVDTCTALVGAPMVEVGAVGSDVGEVLLAADVAIVARHADGSVSAITYGAGGHHSTPKERIEVLGRGRSAVVDDFRRVELDGRQVSSGRQDKGHQQAVGAFAAAVRGGAELPTDDLLASMRATLWAAVSLGEP
ncbi:MAG: putative zinc-binding dehydrogenase [Actinomycetia bacterium]|nr:putative zinc-binding dehydrogenase [Actinomycetes bacterium]